MRPVRLDLNGFASFRDPAVVDFTDADYFALVGPTGSGKSTVIDAMTFALYGSAPRWGNRTAIADALAPTTNRCTVRLLFDLGGARYVVAREVRRVGKTPQQKNCVLERLADPNGTGADGEAPGEVLAGDPKEVTEAVEQLLGLSFTDFCQCVVLPQGKFAEFLSAPARQRQGILLKLLGADQYEAIAKASAQRASLAEQKAVLLQAQLGDLSQATEEAQEAALEQESSLVRLVQSVEAALPVVAAAVTEIDAASAEHDRLTQERGLLAALAAPPDVTRLQAQLDLAAGEHRAAVGAEVLALEQDGAARAALAAGPDRARLEQVLERRAEQDRLVERRPALNEADQAASLSLVAAAGLVEAQAIAVATARDLHDEARAAQAAAAAELAALRRRGAALGPVSVPDGVDQLGAGTSAARQELTAARATREQADVSDQQARDALAQAPDRGPLEQALKDLADQDRTRQRLAVLTQEHATIRDAVQHTAGTVESARQQLALARADEQAAGAASTAAVLRSHLVSGHSCPVCEQPVATVPAPIEVPELSHAAAVVVRAEQTLEQAQTRLNDVVRQEAAKEAETRSATEMLDRLTAALAGHPQDAGALTAELARLESLAGAVRDRGRELASARDAERAAASALQDFESRTVAARSALRAAHGPLIAEGAPAIDDGDLPGAWKILTDWQAEQVAELATAQLPAAKNVVATATADLDQAQQALADEQQRLAAAHTAHTAAVKAAEQAAGALRALTERLAELDAALIGAPSADEAGTRLELCTQLAADAAQAEQRLRAVREARAAAASRQAQWDTKAGRARHDLRTARDRLVPLGAPPLADDDVAGAWADLISWAGIEADARAEQVPAVVERLHLARLARDKELAAVLSQVRDSGIELADGVPAATLPALVAAALERARSRTALIAERRQRAATLATDVAQAQEQQQVAKLLADLLRSDKFPRWLAATALDALVADASSVLHDLSGGQFDLAHDRGDFIVIDHTDADSSRSVRTLSGGETFQASLALALALSAQLSTLSTAGGAQLDSIFLDEGFGTLDPDTLEVVAGTLETLAHGERMVGVITHVAALADRAPVRFAVHRDNRSSTIVREGA